MIFWDIIKNRNIQFYIFVIVMSKAALSIEANVGQVYMTNELGFSRENLSMIQVISAPCEIIFTVLSSYLSSSRPFRFQFFT